MRRTSLSPYRIMWLFVMFDLPVGTKKERKAATKFRNCLLDLGFDMSQFSVYTKYCRSCETAESIGRQVKKCLPSGGAVDILTITDKQYSNMKRYHAKIEKKGPEEPQQLHIF